MSCSCAGSAGLLAAFHPPEYLRLQLVQLFSRASGPGTLSLPLHVMCHNVYLSDMLNLCISDMLNLCITAKLQLRLLLGKLLTIVLHVIRPENQWPRHDMQAERRAVTGLQLAGLLKVHPTPCAGACGSAFRFSTSAQPSADQRRLVTPAADNISAPEALWTCSGPRGYQTIPALTTQW